jgi:PAS domain S-box-containing protein
MDMINQSNITDILESMPLGVIIADLSGRIQTMNGCAKSCLGVKDHAFEYPTIQDLMGDLRIMAAQGDVGEGERAHEDNRFQTVKKADRLLEIAVTPISRREGTSAGYIMVMKDITEAQRTRELAVKKEKYAALEEFSADIAHEIRNPLGSIELYASLLKKELKRKKDIHRVNQILAATKIVENKIASLILLSKNFDIPTKPVNIHAVLKDILLFSEQIIDGETVFLSANYSDCEPFVECNPDMIKQVFLNLILNALQTMPEKSRLDITTKYQPADHAIDIYFIDNAPDGADQTVTRIFDRFSRISEKSSHLGLAIVHNIINMYKGSLKIEYMAGTGTAFVLSFPIVDGK